jgi:two-component system nitrogen regulation sensor histidine kinase NtrY
MVFKKFRVQLILRVVILTLAIILLAWCLVQGFYLRSVYIAVGVLILLVELIWYIDRFNRDVKTFMTSLMQRDFTTHFNSSEKGKSFDALYEILNQISAAFKKLSTEKEIQYRYLEMLVEHVRVSILSIDADEKIHLANQALKDLLQKNVLTSLKSLESFDQSLVKAIREIRTGETRLIKLTVENELLQLSIHASEFKLENRYYKLISMQNIKTELDIREMEAWQKLIRVLSHEIMNSISPITSLSETLHGVVRQNNNLLNSSNANLYSALDKGLEAIKIRSEGLFNFTQTYRKLTGVPNLSLKKANLKDIVHRVQTLMLPKMTEHNIQLRISDVDVNIEVDPELMEHVFINLILNAIDALNSQSDPCIHIRISKQQKGNLCIHVIDNGEGISEHISEKIFIPFFTTRKNGTGIGLAITKQILQLHHADIQLKSTPGQGTEFIIIL